jgi:hypothetical protein
MGSRGTITNRAAELKPVLLRRMAKLRERFPEGGWVRVEGSEQLAQGYSRDVRRLAFYELARDGSVEERMVGAERQFRAKF